MYSVYQGSIADLLSPEQKERFGIQNPGQPLLAAASQKPFSSRPYRPLRHPYLRDIRLLEVCSQDSSAPSLLNFAFRHASIRKKTKPKYETISYCWGNLSDKRHIVVEGMLLAIPVTTEEALRRFSKRSEENNTALWIDAACIDQTNTDERSQQVAFMADIYQSAVGNLVYLGDDDNGIEAALHGIDLLMREINRETQDCFTLHDTVVTEEEYSRYSETGLSRPVNLQPVVALFERPWFSRLWVIQEVASAPHNTCFCGNFQFALLDVLRVARWLHYKRLHLPLPVGSSRGRSNAVFMWDFVDHHQQRNDMDLSKILEKNQSALATDARDYVFGVLGLMSPRHIERARTHYRSACYLITPDYNKGLVSTMRDATLYALLSGGTLWIWRHISHWSDSFHDIVWDFPSWVPPIHRKGRRYWEPVVLGPRFNAAANSTILGLDDSTDYGALNFDDWRRRFTPFARGKAIFLRGIHVGQVLRASECLPSFAPHTAEVALQCISAVEELLSSPVETTPFAYQHVESAVATTLIGGQATNDRDITDERTIFHQYEAFKRFVRKHGEIPPRPPKHNHANGDDVARAAGQWHWAFLQAAHKRGFFTTSSGHIGLGPGQTRSGDIVAILYGGMWPFILRPCDCAKIEDENDYRVFGAEHERRTHYCVLGAAYVHGIMFGEAFNHHKASGSRDTVFHIR